MMESANPNSVLAPTILFQDEEILVLFKPSTWFVHPPENPIHRRGLKRRTCVQWLMDTQSIKANPVHRLDVPTEGILLFAKTKLSAAHLNEQFKNHTVEKTYHAVVRGWMTNSSGSIELPLELDSTGELVACTTHYVTKATEEFNHSIQKKFSTSRYSLLEIKPKSGRWHQIRRHMNRVSHPIVGDREHGDSRHNRYFRENFKIEGLCLRATSLRFLHPKTLQPTIWNCPQTEKWNIIENLFRPQPLQILSN